VPVRVAPADLKREVSSLLNLGVVFMVSALLTAGSAYAVRLIVLRLDGAFAAGLYQASWTLGGLYAGFVLQAMGTDFYPRLTAVVSDNEAANRLVNEQTQISLLLAGPGVLGTLTVAPIVISLFYTGEFQPAVNVLRWICLGMMLRIVSWPMGYIIVAKGARTMFLVAEIAATVAHVGLALVLVPWLGVTGAGIAFFGLYVWHTFLVWVMARRLTGFTWSSPNARLGLIFLPASAIVMAAVMMLPVWPATAMGLALTLVTGLYALHQLVALMPYQALPRVVRMFAPKPR
jgi:PST family polysaccharide transporter